MNFTQDSAPINPWYRRFWPWFMIALPAITVLGGFLILNAYTDRSQPSEPRAAVAQNPPAAAVDSPPAENAVQLSGMLRLDRETDRVVIALLHANQQSERLELRLQHPTRPNLDQTVQLQREAADRWVGSLSLLAHGRWHIEVKPESGEWRLAGRLNLPDEQQASLQLHLD